MGSLSRDIEALLRDPSSPTILNVVVYSVIQSWVSVVVKVEGKYGQEVFVRYVYNMAAYFYADNGLLVSKRAAILQ